MRSERYNIFFTLTGLYFLADLYMYFSLKTLIPSKYLRIYQVLYILSSLLIYNSFYTFYHLASTRNIFATPEINIHLATVIIALATKLIFAFVMLFQDSLRVLFGLGNATKNALTQQEQATPFIPKRRKFMAQLATSIAAIPFFSLLYGVTKGKYAYTINPVKLAFDNLPKAFNGLKVVQISDIHAGSLDNKSEVARGVQMINDLKPDLIVFTGDLVNSSKDEINPYLDVFKKLNATFGKFAILGNHDYYGSSDDNTYQGEYWADFRSKFQTMGFNLLTNENATVEKDGETIKILGVENWGAGRWFPKYGDLDTALQNVNEDDFCILLSHDPTHWDEKVIPHSRKFPLTLSGHTHGMQFGVNMPGFKWSPAQYRYKKWMGLYEEQGQYLYVNRGYGFLTFPGRVGMWPEITVFELNQV